MEMATSKIRLRARERPAVVALAIRIRRVGVHRRERQDREVREVGRLMMRMPGVGEKDLNSEIVRMRMLVRVVDRNLERIMRALPLQGVPKDGQLLRVRLVIEEDSAASRVLAAL